MPRRLLAIDQGTTSTRSLLVDEAGTTLSLSDSTGSWGLSGTIRAGAISTTGAASIRIDPLSSGGGTLDGVTIVALADIGEVTSRLLDFNNSDRLLERQVLRDVGRYPSAAAVARMASRT